MNYYREIKNELINNEINKRIKNYSINRSDLNTYYNVGKMLSEAGKHYGEGIIKEYSERLTLDIGKGYGISNLKRMRPFYYIIEKGVALPHQLSWSHILSLLPIDDINEINYYIDVSIKQSLSYRELRNKIKNNEYDRIDAETKNKLINKEKSSVVDFVKNPIIIKNSNNYETISEKVLQKLILEDIESFMKELGNSFCFIGSEYKIRIGNNFNYIDLLLFNYEYNCFIVVELKTTELKKEHIGQIQVYMNYIDENLKKFNQDKTIGIIICKQDNKYVIKYCSDDRIIAREYELVWYNMYRMWYLMKDKYWNVVNEFKLKKKTKETLKRQIDVFYSYENKDNNKNIINDEVILSTSNLIHGSRASIETLEIISKEGLIASEFYDNFNPNKKKPYVVELWDIKEEINLSSWIKKYAGVTIDFKNREGIVYKSVISSFDEIKSNIKNEAGFRDYIIYQNQEQRFVPNDIVDNEVTVAFIVEFNENNELIKNDIFSESFDNNILKDILPKWFYEKYMKTRKFDNYETGREKAILFGIPVSMIKGIIVSRKIEHDLTYTNKIKELFPTCYICNIDGKLI